MAQYLMEIPLSDHSNAFVILFSYFLVKHEVEYLYLIAVSVLHMLETSKEERCSVTSCPLIRQPPWGRSGHQCSQRPQTSFSLSGKHQEHLCSLPEVCLLLFSLTRWCTCVGFPTSRFYTRCEQINVRHALEFEILYVSKFEKLSVSHANCNSALTNVLLVYHATR